MYQNGLESPLFDTKYTGASDIVTTVELPQEGEDRRVAKVRGRCKNNGALATLTFEHENGSLTTIFDKNCRQTSFREEVREIPVGHSIIGFYGRLNPNGALRYLGFIIAEAWLFFQANLNLTHH